MLSGEILSGTTLQTIAAEVKILVGGGVEIVEGGPELEVTSKKYPRLPLGGRAVERVELIENFPLGATLQLTTAYGQSTPIETRLEVHSYRAHWGVDSRLEPDTGTLTLHAVYFEDRPADYPGFLLWEEVNVDLGPDGNVTGIWTDATATKGFGPGRSETEVRDVRSHRWGKTPSDKNMLVIKEDSSLRIMFSQIGLPMAFIEGEDFGFGEGLSTHDVHALIKERLRAAFKKI